MHTITDFFNKYSLIENPYSKDNNNLNGFLIEGSAKELHYLSNYALSHHNHIWTVYQYEDRMVIKAGLKASNIGHLITDKPYSYLNEEYVDLFRNNNLKHKEKEKEIEDDLKCVA